MRETQTLDGSARAAMRAAMCTPIPAMSLPSFDLAGMNAGAHLESELARAVTDRAGTTSGAHIVYEKRGFGPRDVLVVMDGFIPGR